MVQIPTERALQSPENKFVPAWTENEAELLPPGVYRVHLVKEDAPLRAPSKKPEFTSFPALRFSPQAYLRRNWRKVF